MVWPLKLSRAHGILLIGLDRTEKFGGKDYDQELDEREDLEWVEEEDSSSNDDIATTEGVV